MVRAPEDDIDMPPANTIECRDTEYVTGLAGLSQLLYIRAMLIANLRRDAPPPEVPQLFHRLWAEKGPWLSENLTIRWRISAATTFADHGVSMG
jgi:hypothetical protein